jgi:hypothetical protein
MSELAELQRLEALAHHELKNTFDSWVRCVDAIMAIKKDDLWRANLHGYTTWSEYVKHTFDDSYERVRQLIAGYEIGKMASDFNLYITEGASRAIKRYQKEEGVSSEKLMQAFWVASQVKQATSDKKPIVLSEVKAIMDVIDTSRLSGGVYVAEEFIGLNNPLVASAVEAVQQVKASINANRNKNRAYIQATVTAQAGKTLTLQLPDDSLVFGAGEQITIIVEVIE